MSFQRYELKKNDTNRDEYTIVVYLNDYLTEFADELGSEPNKRKDFVQNVRKMVKERYPKLKISVIKVVLGGVAITTIPLLGNHDYVAHAEELTPSTTQSAHEQNVSYYVRTGDTLWAIARDYQTTVDVIKKANNLASNTLQVNQRLIIPKTMYTVASGDTLYSLARNFDTSVDAIKSANGFASTTITVGQTLVIPQMISGQASATFTNSEVSRTYTVATGDSLWVIANRHDITVQAIKVVNNLQTDVLQIGQTLIIPTQGIKLDSIIEVPTTINVQYTVKTGDSLWAIANNYGTSVDALKTTNNLDSVRLQIGQQLIIPKEEGAVTAPAVTPAKSTYKVASGDTLYSIAKKYNMSVDNLKSINNLSTNSILVGQVIAVDGLQPTNATPTTNIDSSLQDVQRNLQQLGYYDVPTMTGSYDLSTKQAITNFQKDYGLSATGTVNSETSTAIQQAIVKQALIKDTVNYSGVPYLWGGTTPSGFDCSGFVYFMFNKHGVDMSRNTSSGLYTQGTTIDRGDLMPGDLVFFSIEANGRITHVGFYMGDNQFISATSSSGIKAVSMDNSYWSKYYVGAKRIY